MSQPKHWTPEVKAAFIDALAASGEVLAAVKTVGLSPQSAYRHRAHDPEFARAWDSARLIAREVALEELNSRALHGWDENVFFRGELVGTKKRHDNRLLLALLARLDRLAGDDGVPDARCAPDQFGHLVDTLASGQDTDSLYAPTKGQQVEIAEQEAALRRRWRHAAAEMAAMDEQEERDGKRWVWVDEGDEPDWLNNVPGDADCSQPDDDDDPDIAAGDDCDSLGQPLSDDARQRAAYREYRRMTRHHASPPAAEQLSAARGYHPVSPLPPPPPPTDRIEPDENDWRTLDAPAEAPLRTPPGDRNSGPAIRML